MPPARSERLRSVAASGVARKATHALSLTAEADAFVRPTACRRGCARTAVLRAADTADRSLQALPPSPIPSHPIPPMETNTANARGQLAKWSALCRLLLSVTIRVECGHYALCGAAKSHPRRSHGSRRPRRPFRSAPRLASPTRRLPALLYRSRRLGRAEPSEAPTARHVWLRLRC